MKVTKKCAGCPVTFSTKHVAQRFHTLRCFARWRQRQTAWLEAQRRGMLRSRQTKVRRAIERASARIAGCRSRAEAFRIGRRDGISIGWKRGQRVGFAQGYDAAIKDMGVTHG